MNENIQALFDMGKIEAPTEELARAFCRASKIGEYKCAVTTRFGFFCDLCLEEELLYLKSVGVHTVASCCGHGNAELASILTAGETSREAMQNMGYELTGCLCGRDNWRPKSILLYNPLAEPGLGQRGAHRVGDCRRTDHAGADDHPAPVPGAGGEDPGREGKAASGKDGKTDRPDSHGRARMEED